MAKKTILTSDLSGDPITTPGYQIRVSGHDFVSVLDVTEAEALEWATKGTAQKRRGRKPMKNTSPLTTEEG